MIYNTSSFTSSILYGACKWFMGVVEAIAFSIGVVLNAIGLAPVIAPWLYRKMQELKQQIEEDKKNETKDEQ